MGHDPGREIVKRPGQPGRERRIDDGGDRLGLGGVRRAEVDVGVGLDGRDPITSLSPEQHRPRGVAPGNLGRAAGQLDPVEIGRKIGGGLGAVERDQVELLGVKRDRAVGEDQRRRIGRLQIAPGGTHGDADPARQRPSVRRPQNVVATDADQLDARRLDGPALGPPGAPTFAHQGGGPEGIGRAIQRELVVHGPTVAVAQHRDTGRRLSAGCVLSARHPDRGGD